MTTITSKQINLLKKLDKENPLIDMTCTEYAWLKHMMNVFPEQDVYTFPGLENLTRQEASETITIALEFARHNRSIDRKVKKAEISDGNVHAGDKVRTKAGLTGTVESVDGLTTVVKLDDGQIKKFHAKFLETI